MLAYDGQELQVQIPLGGNHSNTGRLKFRSTQHWPLPSKHDSMHVQLEM